MRSTALRLLCTLALAGAAVAQGPKNPGPDVIVGELIDTTSYGGDAATPGVLAFDVGTLSCNEGNVDLQWVASTNQHPVIAQNVYRLADGRLEQIGLSWVKHGFFALTGSVCSTCNGVGGSVLGVGCSDPYEGGLNGLQGALGPRSAINPATGFFVYNSTTPSTWPPTGNSRLARRIRIAEADIAPALNPGAQYFAEAVYITPDDAGAGNGSNNASYRAMRFTGSPVIVSSLVAQAPTLRTRPAIFAWRDYGNGMNPDGTGIPDPAVRLTPVDIPGDGRLWLGSKVVASPDGSFRYEYALYNLNADRAVGGFDVPLPGALPTPPTALSARLPAHHSGEPYSTTPWTSQTVADAAVFAAGQTFSQNPDANALRWGTLANFTLTAQAQPATGLVRIRLFEPGSGAFAGVSELLVEAPTPGGATFAPPAPPAGDTCAAPIPANHGANGFTLAGAAPSSAAACATDASDADLWLSYTYVPHAATCPGQIVFDSCGSSFAARLSVFEACSGQPVCEDDVAPCGAGSSRVSTPAIAGRTYLIRVQRTSGSGVAGVLNITAPFCLPPIGACCTPAGTCSIVQGSCSTGTFLGAGTLCSPNPCPQPPPPANDRCENALPVADGTPVVGRNVGAVTNSTDACFGSGFSDVWYAYTPQTSGTVVLDTCTPPAAGAAFDTVLSIRTTCTGTDLSCSDDACSTFSRLSLSLNAGQRYLIRVAGFGGAQGDFALRVTGGGGVLPPTGACCRGATCVVLGQDGCGGLFSRFAGIGSGCAACCRADFDQGGSITVDDIFVFLNAWFAQDATSAITSNGAASPGIDDVFVFLNAWFTGC